MAAKTKRSKTKRSRRVGNGAGMCGPFAITNEHAIGIHTFVVPPPRWETTREAIAYLRGPFHDWLAALHDLAAIGAHAPRMITHDLECIAQALADFLENPRPMDSGGETGGAVEALRRCILETVDKSSSGLTTDGLIFEVAEETLPLLNYALGYAMKARRDEEETRAEVSA